MRIAPRWAAAFCAAVILSIAVTAIAADSTKPILGTGSYWRAYEVRADRVCTGDASAKPFGPMMRTSNPPANWREPDFDDAAWWRTPGPFWDENVAVFCLRAKFPVTDPRSVKKLTLALSHCGGVVVFINGKEVLRRDLPAGKLTMDTPAAPYPLDAYVDAKGKLLPSPYHMKQREGKGEKGLLNRLKLRVRKTEPFELPVSALRKGTNVLAVEVHRSSYQPVARPLYTSRKRPQWPHVALRVLSLTAEGSGIASIGDRPDGLQVWNQDIHAQFGFCAYGDVTESLTPVRIVGVRNGQHSGQVVVSSTQALEGLKAEVSELKAAGGTIPASQVQVRYPMPSKLGIAGRKPGLHRARWQSVPAFAPLMDTPPAVVKPVTYRTRASTRAALGLPGKMKPAVVQPVWVTVSVPKDAVAGKYTGTLTVSARGLAPVAVPVELEVSDWTAPDPRDYRTFTSIYQSPESLAVQYNTPLWSEKHWQVLEQSFKLLGHNGNRLLVMPLVTRTEYGNDEGRVPWLRQANGTYRYDFTVHDRLIKLASKYCKLKAIAYQVYRSNGWGAPKPEKPNFVTVVDAKTGKRESMKLASYNTPESVKQWASLFAEIRKRLAKGGIAEGVRPILGMGHDGGTNRQVVANFKKCFPEGSWQYGGHNRPRQSRNRSGYMGYIEYLYVSEFIPAPQKARRRGWNTGPDATYILMSQRLRDPIQTAMMVRTMGERALLLGDMGAGKMCLDYWPVKGSVRVMNRTLYSRWPESSAKQRSPHLVFLGYPGPKGAVTTCKYELMHEGLQETEARIFVEDALVNKKITGDLAKRALALLDRRADLCRVVHLRRRPLSGMINAGWQARSRSVYRMAAEVAKTARVSGRKTR
jgi:glycosyl hydrolase family 123